MKWAWGSALIGATVAMHTAGNWSRAVKVIAHFHQDTRRELNRWARSLSPDAAQGRAFGRVFLTALLQALEQQAGPPPGAERVAGISPPTWWWEYDPDFWVKFVVRDEWPPFWKPWAGRIRRITIVRIARRPRNRAMPASHPG